MRAGTGSMLLCPKHLPSALQSRLPKDICLMSKWKALMKVHFRPCYGPNCVLFTQFIC